MDFLDTYFKYDNNLTITGLTNELAHIYVSKLFQEKNKNIIVLTSTLYEANNLFNGIKPHQENTYLFPMDDFLTSQALAISPELKTTRIETLENLKHNKGIIVTNLMGYLKYLTDTKVQNKLNIKLKKGDDINRDKLIEILENLDYKRDTMVTTTGEYAVRGFVIDIFITLSEHPIRLEFFGNTIESIRYFDEGTQMSTEEIEEVTLISNGEINTESKSSLYDYANNPVVVTVDANRLNASYKKLEEEMFEYKVAKDLDPNTKFMFSYNEINPSENIYLNFIDNKPNSDNVLSLPSKEIANFNSNLDRLQESCSMWHKKGYEIIFYLHKEK